MYLPGTTTSLLPFTSTEVADFKIELPTEEPFLPLFDHFSFWKEIDSIIGPVESEFIHIGANFKQQHLIPINSNGRILDSLRDYYKALQARDGLATVIETIRRSLADLFRRELPDDRRQSFDVSPKLLAHEASIAKKSRHRWLN